MAICTIPTGTSYHAFLAIWAPNNAHDPHDPSRTLLIYDSNFAYEQAEVKPRKKSALAGVAMRALSQRIQAVIQAIEKVSNNALAGGIWVAGRGNVVLDGNKESDRMCFERVRAHLVQVTDIIQILGGLDVQRWAKENDAWQVIRDRRALRA